MLKILVIFLLLCGICYAQFPPPVEITEEDGSPSAYPYKVKNTNNAVTDNGDGTESIEMILTSAPADPDDTCSPGQIAYDGGYVYVCVSTDTWKRASISTW